MKRVLIVTGGDIKEDFGIEFLKKKTYDFIIAVDGGMSFLAKAGVVPDYIIGDFDTLPEDTLNNYIPSKAEIIRLNPVKDSTDTEEAVNLAIKLKAANVDILGGLGSRFDHSLGNIFLLEKMLKKNIKGTIYCHNSQITMIDKGCVIENPHRYRYISFIQFDGAAKGVTLKNFKYTIENFDFDTKKTFRLGVSNEFIGDTGQVEIKEGKLLVIMTND